MALEHVKRVEAWVANGVHYDTQEEAVAAYVAGAINRASHRPSEVGDPDVARRAIVVALTELGIFPIAAPPPPAPASVKPLVPTAPTTPFDNDDF